MFQTEMSNERQKEWIAALICNVTVKSHFGWALLMFALFKKSVLRI